MSLIRSEAWELTYAPQYRDDGVGLATVEYSDSVLYPLYITNVLGIWDTGQLPDPTFEHTHHFGQNTQQPRVSQLILKGRAVMSGSIGDIVLLGGQSMRIPVGPCADYCVDSGTLGSSTLTYYTSQSQVSCIVGSSTNFVVGDIVRIGAPQSSLCEYHKIYTLDSAWQFTVYQHIEVTSWTGSTPPATTQLTGLTSGKIITVQFATRTEVHGLCSGDFTIGETLSGGAGAYTCVVTKQKTGLKFAHPAGDIVKECTDVISDNTIKAGDQNFTVMTAADWTTGDYVCIGPESKCAEIRQVTKSGSTLTFTTPLSYDHSHLCGLTKMNVTGGVYTHTITIDQQLSPIQISTVQRNIDGDYLQRRYVGCKVNRGVFTCRMNEWLTMSLDDIIARTIRYRDPLSSAVSPFYSANIYKPDPANLTTEPFYFSYGSLSYGGSTFARVNEANIEVSNGIEAKYYMADSWDTGNVPWEIREGKAEVRANMNIDVDDDQRNFFADLLAQGNVGGVFKGLQLVLTFTRGASDTIVFTLPPATPAIGVGNQGCILRSSPHPIGGQSVMSSSVEVLARDLKIVVTDSIPSYV